MIAQLIKRLWKIACNIWEHRLQKLDENGKNEELKGFIEIKEEILRELELGQDFNEYHE